MLPLLASKASIFGHPALLLLPILQVGLSPAPDIVSNDISFSLPFTIDHCIAWGAWGAANFACPVQAGEPGTAVFGIVTFPGLFVDFDDLVTLDGTLLVWALDVAAVSVSVGMMAIIEKSLSWVAYCCFLGIRRKMLWCKIV